MLFSKWTNKAGKRVVTILVKKTDLVPTKNPDFYRINLNEDFVVGLDDKKQAPIAELINLDKLVDNTK